MQGNNNQNVNDSKEVEAIVISSCTLDATNNVKQVKAIVIDSHSSNKEFRMLNKKKQREAKKKNVNKKKGRVPKMNKAALNAEYNNKSGIKSKDLKNDNSKLIRPVLFNGNEIKDIKNNKIGFVGEVFSDGEIKPIANVPLLDKNGRIKAVMPKIAEYSDVEKYVIPEVLNYCQDKNREI